MRKSFSVIVMSAALLITGGTAADAAGTSAGVRKVIKTKTVGTSKGGPVVIKTGKATTVIKTTGKLAAKHTAKPAPKAVGKKAVAKKPATNKPVTNKPVTKKPVTKKPLMKKAATKKRAAR